MKLSNYITQIRGVSYKKSDLNSNLEEGYIPVIRANNIQNGKLIFEDLVYVKKERIKEVQMIKKGDIIIAASSGSKNIVGKAAQAKEDIEMSFGAFCKLIRPNEKINNNYLGHFFNSKRYRQTVSSLAEGANINNLKNEHIDDLKIPVPPMEEQEKIVKILDEAQNLIDKRKEQIDLMDKLTESIFYDMFGDPVKNEKGWDVEKLGSLINEIQSGWSPKCMGERALESEYGILKLSAVTGGKYNPFENKKMLEGTEPKLAYEVKSGDLLMTRKNTPQLVGDASYVFETREKLMLPDTIFRIETKETIEKLYLLHLINHKKFSRKIKNLASGSAKSMSNISKQKLKEMFIPIPTLSLQIKFAEKVKTIEEQKKLLEKSLHLMEDNYNSLMQKAFKGELF